MTTPAQKRRNRLQTERRRKQYLARSPEQIAEAQAARYPDGHATCKRCGQRRPLRDFKTIRHQKHALALFCNYCPEPAPVSEVTA